MRALQFLGGSKAQLITAERPAPRPGWAVVKVHYASLCGSDLWLYKGQWHGNTYPIVPGHEWSGEVVEVNGADESWVGRRVIGDLIVECHVCGPCRDGLPVMCENMIEIGFMVDGGCAEYVAVPVANLYPLPDELDLASACQVEPLSVAVHAVDRVNVRPSERVAVLGAGGIGLMLSQAAQAAGARVLVATDPVPERREVALGLGAEAAYAPEELPDPKGYDDKFDVVLEASGDPSSVARAIELVRPGGRIGLIGYQVGATHPIATADLPLSYASLIGVMGPGGKYRQAVNLLARGAINVKPILTDVVGLEEFAPALDRAVHRTGGTLRVVFDMRAG
jgi:2-desacetyl-2-hydroxyethyl bacteriochlorophyllide A dehydrogenase